MSAVESSAKPASSLLGDSRVVSWVFLRALGIIYGIAFVSLWVQIVGLVGSHGILPVRDFLATARQYFDNLQFGLDRFRLLPTLAWFNPSDAALVAQCAVGTGLSVLLIAGIAPGICLVALWALYLSLTVAGQDFMGFQWDALLLEAGALAIVLAPWEKRLRPRGVASPSPIAVWLLRLLGFQLMFESGLVKLLSGDQMWRHLTALTVHYQTQPLPTWIGWYAFQLPRWWQVASCAVMFGIELGAPWLVFAGRNGRAAGCALIVFLQILILLTGNYTFFNWLAIALLLLWIDDAMLARLIPNRIWSRLAASHPPVPTLTQSPWRHLAPGLMAAIVIPVSVAQFGEQAGIEPTILAPVRAAGEWLAPFRTINTYGLFAVMTTTRDEIVIEGSDDQVTWLTYEFKDKPGNLYRRPAFVAPYQPRLDWQMWFAALGSVRSNPWFTNLCVQLLEGSPAVLSLLSTNPFPDHPPRFIRAELYDYRFTTLAEHRATGAWWTRTPAGEYFPVSSLRR